MYLNKFKSKITIVADIILTSFVCHLAEKVGTRILKTTFVSTFKVDKTVFAGMFLDLPK